jgi:hypothetical protein
MSQPPPPPGNPPQYGTSDGAVPPPPPQGAPPQNPPPGGYGYPAQAPGSTPAGPPPPGAENPYATPPPPGQNPYAAAPTQPAFPQGQFPQQQPQQPPQQQPQGPPPPPGYGYPSQQSYGQEYGQQGFPGQQQYAQTPPTAPQGPYGYPQQTPPPAYGQQPPYDQQPPYGQQGAPGGRSNNRLVIIVAAVVAAVLVIGGGVFLATRGGGDDPKPKPQASSGGPSGGPTANGHNTQLAYKYAKPAETVAEKDNLKDALGIWFTDKYVVKNQINQVVGYDINTGAQVWAVPAPSGIECTAARDQYNNIAAIQYGANCDKVMAIDMAAGRMMWTQTLPGDSGSKVAFDSSEMAISGNVVGVDWIGGSIAYRLTDQKVLWRSGDGACEDDGYAGGSQFVAVVDCNLNTYKVQVIDTANNGASKWSWTAPSGIEVNAIVSTNPVVVLLGTDGQTYSDVAVLANGRLQSRISLGTNKYEISDDGIEKQSVHNVLVDKNSVYLTLNSEGDSSGKVLSGIAAFRLSDGTSEWLAKPTGNYDITGIGFQGGKVLAYEAPDYEKPGKMVTLDPASGAISTYATFANDAYNRLESGGLHDYFVWHDNRFYCVTKTVYAGEKGQKYLLVYG